MHRPIPKVLWLVLVVGLAACAGSQRQTALKAALVTVDAARDGFLAFDAAEHGGIGSSATPDEVFAELAKLQPGLAADGAAADAAAEQKFGGAG